MELQIGGLSTAKYEYQRCVNENTHLFLKINKYGRCERVLQLCWLLHLCCVSAAVEEAAALASVSLRPLEEMDSMDVAAPAREGATLTALLKLCNRWQKPGAGLQGQCILASPKKFEVDVGYNVDVIAAFKQMPTKNYGMRETIFSHNFSPNCISWFLCVFAADMKTRKWSFSLEDYKRLSE